MKIIVRLFLIMCLFFATMCSNVANLSIDFSPVTNTIQATDNNNTIYQSDTKSVKYLVSSNYTNTNVIFQKKENSKNLFSGFKNIIPPESSQFSILLTYIYNKSYLRKNFVCLRRNYLSEISPNAP